MCDTNPLPLAKSNSCPCNGKCRLRAPPKPTDEQSQSAVLETVAGVRHFDSEQLFAGTKSIAIRHGGENYRLLITRNDRLILQK
jgi:hemin uptake protein HemP